MKWKGVDLQKVLEAERRRQEKLLEDEVLNAYRKLFEQEDLIDEKILSNIFDSGSALENIKLQNPDPNRIYRIDQIKKLCIDYRLRFLDANFFKGTIPYDAIVRIKHLQKKEDAELKGFKILAPANMFHLHKKDSDPMLFLALGNNRYYLIHKWGNDLHPLRKLMVFPFRNLKTLLGTVICMAFLLVMCIPEAVILGSDPGAAGAGMIRVICFFYLFIAFSGLTMLYGFSRVKDFNSRLWDSRFFD